MIQTDRLFDSCRPQLYAIALRLCGNTPAAEDAVQEALLLAYTRLHQLREPDAFLPWVSRIVRNCCYQQMRRDKARGLTTVDVGDRMIEDSIDRRYEEMGTRNSLHSALSLLPESLRLTMMLRYVSDYPGYAQIADILGVPVGTVRSRLSEGRKQLTRHWNQLQHVGPGEYGRGSYWDKLYTGLLLGVHKDASDLRTLMEVTSAELKMTFTSGKAVYGRDIFEESIYDDMEHGSGISEVRSCFSSGEVTVMDVGFVNSAEHPEHCPPATYLVIYRDSGLMKHLRMFHSARVVRSLYA
ncbi:MAG: RNA polymerase sigma factor [Bacteroidetes bacterium]|nr:RNA polymerase sigma factor [Bacteroidota bacterium]